VRTAGQTVIVLVSGAVDVTALPALGEYLARALGSQPAHLIVDMGGVTFIDCATARLIIRAGQSLPPGGRVLIRRPSAIARQVLDLTGLARHCDIEAGPAGPSGT